MENVGEFGGAGGGGVGGGVGGSTGDRGGVGGGVGSCIGCGFDILRLVLLLCISVQCWRLAGLRLWRCS